MNSTEVKLGTKAEVSMMTQKHENVALGDKVVIVGVPIVLCRMPDGRLERFYCHELKETKGEEK